MSIVSCGALQKEGECCNDKKIPCGNYVTITGRAFLIGHSMPFAVYEPGRRCRMCQRFLSKSRPFFRIGMRHCITFIHLEKNKNQHIKDIPPPFDFGTGCVSLDAPCATRNTSDTIRERSLQALLIVSVYCERIFRCNFLSHTHTLDRLYKALPLI